MAIVQTGILTKIAEGLVMGAVVYAVCQGKIHFK